jgi:hypothetical protein
MMIRATLAILLLATSAPAMADPGPPLVQRYYRLQGECRTEVSEWACRARDQIEKRLQRQGWCWGAPGEYGAAKQWHRCRRSTH